jgi:hypothetical protein
MGREDCEGDISRGEYLEDLGYCRGTNLKRGVKLVLCRLVEAW